MNKALITLLLVCILARTADAQSQPISFELYGRDNCADTVGRIQFFTLVQDGSTYLSDSTGRILVPKVGKYYISTLYSDILIPYIFKNYEHAVDTINLDVIRECLEPTSHPSFIGYCCCNNRCEGEQTDYYANGSKRIEGCFKAGVPQGDVRMFYPNGQLKQVDSYSNKGYLKKRMTYSEEGVLLKREKF